MLRNSPNRPLALLLVFAFCCGTAQAESQRELDALRRSARSILSDKCFTCHGPDEGSREADLRLDTMDGATADLGGHQAVVPGKLAASELIQRIRSTDEDLRMPPADSKLSLSEAEIRTLEKWVERGAGYAVHWSFQAIQRPQPPAIDRAATPIDAFVLRKLHAAKLKPSPSADRETLIRRVYLDLLGLPPTPAQVRAFVQDRSPAAYERMVQQALASPHFGERWGRHWLDQARYADTHGYTVDSERTMWPYRDWVIGAVNGDMPFDQFTIEQLAGDLLASPTPSQMVATGFHRNTLVNQEGGSDREQFRNEAVVDRVNTTGAVWLGLTLGCAQCHSHKFDPISHEDYYKMFAFFNSQQDANGVGPTVQVASPQAREQLRQLDEKLADAKQQLQQYDSQRDSQRPAADQRKGSVQWKVVKAFTADSDAGAEFESLDDGSWVVKGDNADSDQYTLRAPLADLDIKRLTAVRVETLTHPSLPKGGPGRAGNGNFVLNAIELSSGASEAEWLHATADHSQRDYPVTAAIDGDLKTGWAINVERGKRMNVNRTAVFVAKALPLKPVAKELVLRMRFGDTPAKYNIGRFRIAFTDASHTDLQLPDPQRTELKRAVDQAKQARDKYAKSFPQAMVMRDLDKPRTTHVHIRGDFLRKGDEVQPNTPAALPAMPARKSESLATRLDLAQWLVAPRNPLTARVTVNRVWGRLFGKPIVETENDFGTQSVQPSHPDLLDHLASDFQRDWSLKRLIHSIVTSDVYRQSSAHRDDLAKADPLNHLLGRQNRIRVDAEIVRDLGLSVSGLLSKKIGGKSVRPPQPAGVYAFTQRNAGWPTSKGADRYRRGMYTFFMRSAPYPMLTTFDTPKFNTTCTRRVRSNTPLQALTLANDETMIEAAQHLGKRIADFQLDDNQTPSAKQRLAFAWQLCFARPGSDKAIQIMEKYYQTQRAGFAAEPEGAKSFAGAAIADAAGDGGSAEADPADRAAWVAVARVLLNLDEFIVRE